MEGGSSENWFENSPHFTPPTFVIPKKILKLLSLFGLFSGLNLQKPLHIPSLRYEKNSQYLVKRYGPKLNISFFEYLFFFFGIKNKFIKIKVWVS